MNKRVVYPVLFLVLPVFAAFMFLPAVVPSLKEVFGDKFMIGVALNSAQIDQRNEQETALISSQFNVVTPENIMKWMYIQPKIDEFNFEMADKLVSLAESRNMAVIGHTLVWHSQLPPWVFSSQDGNTVDSVELMHRIKYHITGIVSRYKGRVKGWDVVNEALDEDGTLRKSSFLTIAGQGFIANAFRFAHDTDPGAELYYNDYNLVNADKRQGAIRLISDLQQQGIRIDAVGIQAHWDLKHPSLQEIEHSIEEFSALGIKVMFTELDISVLPSPWNMPNADISRRAAENSAMNPYPEGLPDSVADKLASRYEDIFRLFARHSDEISRITFWGLHDGLSWKNNFPIRGRSDYPLLFDRNMAPKKAFFSVISTADE